MAVKGIDVLQMQISHDLGLVVSGVVGGIGRKRDEVVVVVLEVIKGDPVMVHQKQSGILVYVLTHNSVQHGRLHKSNAGYSTIKGVRTILHHADHTGLVLGGEGFVIGTALKGSAGHTGINMGSFDPLFAKSAFDMISLIADGIIKDSNY